MALPVLGQKNVKATEAAAATVASTSKCSCGAHARVEWGALPAGDRRDDEQWPLRVIIVSVSGALYHLF